MGDEQILNFLGAARGCADFRDPTAVFRFKRPRSIPRHREFHGPLIRFNGFRPGAIANIAILGLRAAARLSVRTCERTIPPSASHLAQILLFACASVTCEPLLTFVDLNSVSTPAVRLWGRTLILSGGPCLSLASWSALPLASVHWIWPDWASMVLDPFAETKGSRLPGRNPASIESNARRSYLTQSCCFARQLIIFRRLGHDPSLRWRPPCDYSADLLFSPL